MRYITQDTNSQTRDKMTNRLKNRTPKETFSGNAAGGLYHGTGDFLGRFCFGGAAWKQLNILRQGLSVSAWSMKCLLILTVWLQSLII